MERPQVNIQPKQRDITGEIVYLDTMRRLNEYPTPYREISDMAIQMYESEVGLFEANGIRPDIMDEYERHDNAPSEVVASCLALSDELLALKEPSNRLTFVDIVVESKADAVLEKFRNMAAGKVLAGEDEQLAIPSDGEYYPVLDIRKQNAKLVGVGLRAWGWDEQKTVFTHTDGEDYTYPKQMLFYPSDEKSSTRQLEVSFSYQDEKAGQFLESVSLHIGTNGSASISGNVWAAAYAETGYEGHRHISLPDVTDGDIAAFGDLVAEIVGDNPESAAMYTDRRLKEITDAAATPSGKQAIQELIEITWPAQATYFLAGKFKGEEKTIAEQLSDEKTADGATEAVRGIINEWKKRGQS